MNEELTDWFYGTAPPVREGVYETRCRGTGGHVLAGYSYFMNGAWCCTQKTPEQAHRCRYVGAQQTKEWRGLSKEPK